MCISTYAQFGPQQIISTETEGPYKPQAFDINKDGFLDILSAAGEDNKLRWYRNINGTGIFDSEIIISEDIALYLSIDFVDVDSDGDNDILYLENNPRNVGWLENIDGFGDFGPDQFIIENQSDYITGIKTFDLDNDGDLDLLASFTNAYDRIVWYENIGQGGLFSEEIIIIENVFEIFPPLLVDIDNDDKKDILTANENEGAAKIVWYKNLGNATFGPEQVIYQFDFIQSDLTSIYDIHYENINSDGKKDIIITSHNDDFGTFRYWLENIDEEGNFGSLELIEGVLGLYKFYDIDNDDDNDLLCIHRNGNRIYWIENVDGSGNFIDQHTITTEVDNPNYADFADINNDGLKDIISSSGSDSKLAWYENLGNLGVSDNTINQFTLYPNPTEEFITITSEQNISSVEVYNIIGQKISETKSKTEVDLSHFNIGIYFIKIMDDSGNSETHKIIKE